MSLLAYQPDLVSRPRPQPNQVDEWRVESLDYGLRRRMSCRLTLGCGHQIPLAVGYPVECDAERYADAEARRKLTDAVKEHVDTHDCVAYVRQRAIAAVTARLKE